MADMMWFYRLQARISKSIFPQRAARWRRWKQHDPVSAAIISHDVWNAFLAAYVITSADGVNRILYAEVSPHDRAQLWTYIADCESVPISTYARAEQYAFWLNLYNAITVKTVLEHYPIRSLRNIGIVPSWLGGGPWDRPRIRVENEPLSLNDIEHRILRHNWRDPRIHYAINCAAVGCPNLPRLALRGSDLDRTLDALAAAFINSPRGVHFDGKRLSACRIFSWFREDFGGTAPGILEHLQRYASQELRAKLQGRTQIDGYHYDWSLNDAKRAKLS
jgi:hypothetical protein